MERSVSKSYPDRVSGTGDEQRMEMWMAGKGCSVSFQLFVPTVRLTNTGSRHANASVTSRSQLCCRTRSNAYNGDGLRSAHCDSCVSSASAHRMTRIPRCSRENRMMRFLIDAFLDRLPLPQMKHMESTVTTHVDSRISAINLRNKREPAANRCSVNR